MTILKGFRIDQLYVGMKLKCHVRGETHICTVEEITDRGVTLSQVISENIKGVVQVEYAELLTDGDKAECL